MTTLLDSLDPEKGGFWNLRFPTLPLSILLAASFILYCVCDALRGALWILDGVDLLIHEAGHPIFGLLGNEFLGYAGGTLMQLLMPAAFYMHFLRDRKPKSADACLFWVGQNLLWIGRYMADARARVLPLVGGGEHDWAYMFGALGVLEDDVGIGRVTDLLGCSVMALSAYALYCHYYARREAQ